MKKRVLSLLLTVVMMVSLLPNAFAAKQPTFTDVSKDMWCFDYVEFVADKGYFKGTTATTFNPNGTMTRQQFVTVLARMAGVKVDNSVSAFSDVPAGSYSAGSVAWAVKNGIVTGYADGTFKPTNPVTRQQMCAFMSRFMDWYSDTYGAYFLKKGTVSGFADYDQIADYAVDAVDRCRTYGLILGYAEDNTFRPANSATRAHVAAVIYRLAQILRLAGGGGSHEPDYTYTLNFINTNVAEGEEAEVKTFTYSTDATSHTFEVEVNDPTNPVDEITGEPLNALLFLNWTDNENTYVAVKNADEKNIVTVEMTADETTKNLTAVWANPDDLLYIAMNKAAVEANDLAAAKMDKVNDKTSKYATGAASVALEPTTDDDAGRKADRQINLTASAELQTLVVDKNTGKTATAVVDKVIEVATDYALQLVACTTKGELLDIATTTKEDCYDIVDGILKEMGVDNWWTEGTYREKVTSLGNALYEDIKNQAYPYGADLWQNFKVEGKAITTKASVMDGSTVLLKAEGKNLFNADGSALTYKGAVARVAKTAALKLYSSLQSVGKGETFVYDFVGEKAPAATLKLVFTMNDKDQIEWTNSSGTGLMTFEQINYPFSKTYNVTAKLELVQEENILGYRFANGENQAQLIITDFMQAEYMNSVDEVAKAAMTNQAAVDYVEGMVMAQLNAKLAEYGDAAKGIDVAKVVEDWVKVNMSTEKTAKLAPFYLPFDFFWNLGGELKDGELYVNGVKSNRHLCDNDDLYNMIDDVLATYGIEADDGKVEAIDIQEAIETKIKTATGYDENEFKWLEESLNNYPTMADKFKQQIKDAEADIVAKVEAKMGNLNTLVEKADAAYEAEYGVAGAVSDYVKKTKPLNYLGLTDTYPINATTEQQILQVLAEVATVDVDGMITEAMGAYAKYLNQVGLVKTFEDLKEVPVSKLVSLLKNETFRTVVKAKFPSAPDYLAKLAKAIAKIENNGSSVFVAGQEISNSTLTDVKKAVKSGDVDDLCDALAAFLTPFKDMSISTFEDGVYVYVDAEAMGYQANAGVRVFLKVE